MTQPRPSGPCAVGGCPKTAGHGPEAMFCRDHAADIDARSVAALERGGSRITRMKVHSGPRAPLPCGHDAVAGSVVVGWREGWTCDRPECFPVAPGSG